MGPLPQSVKATCLAKSSWQQRLFWCAGMVNVGLAMLGAMLPGMPTTIFLIIALACFGRSSPKWAAKLLAHPRYGGVLQQWQQFRVVPIRAKWFATLGMTLGWLLLYWQQDGALWVWAFAVFELLILLWIWQFPSKVPNSADATNARQL